MKNILITGTTSGIGQVLANYLSEKGYTVIGTSRKQFAEKGAFRIFALDVTQAVAVEKLMEAVSKRVGKIDVLINNAGYGMAGPIEDTSIEEAKAQFETNYFGVLRMTKAVLPLMRKNGGGLIINMSSIAGLMGMPFQGHYAASKFALEGLTESLRMELKPFNIRVCNINPGDFKTNFASSRRLVAKVSPDYQERFQQVRDIYETDESNGADPILIAKLVERLIRAKGRPRIRYLVGHKMQVFSAKLKYWLGDNLFEKGLEDYWKT